MNTAILLLGSNIDPQKNIQKALVLLQNRIHVIKESQIYQTRAVGSQGPDFLNQAVLIETKLEKHEIKNDLIIEIETQLKRVRTENKYAPRTIDLDLVVFNSEVLDDNVWKFKFAAQPVSELEPDLKDPKSGRSISDLLKNLE